MMKHFLNPVVVKLGGSSLGSSRTLVELARLVRKLQDQNLDVVIVHGGGPAINQELTNQGIEWTFVHGQRKTSEEMMGIIHDVLFHKVNGMIVDSLNQNGIPAIGLSGANEKILFCRQADPELGWVGQVMKVDVQKITTVSKVSVIAPVGYGANGELYNINADWAAAKIAIALGARQLIFLTDQKGILDAKKNLIQEATAQDLLDLIGCGVVSGGMRTKVLAMIAALDEGVPEVLVTHADTAAAIVGTALTRFENPNKQTEEKGRFYGKSG